MFEMSLTIYRGHLGMSARRKGKVYCFASYFWVLTPFSTLLWLFGNPFRDIHFRRWAERPTWPLSMVNSIANHVWEITNVTRKRFGGHKSLKDSGKYFWGSCCRNGKWSFSPNAAMHKHHWVNRWQRARGLRWAKSRDTPPSQNTTYSKNIQNNHFPCPIWLDDRVARQRIWMEEVPRHTSLAPLCIGWNQEGLKTSLRGEESFPFYGERCRFLQQLCFNTQFLQKVCKNHPQGVYR